MSHSWRWRSRLMAEDVLEDWPRSLEPIQLQFYVLPSIWIRCTFVNYNHMTETRQHISHCTSLNYFLYFITGWSDTVSLGLIWFGLKQISFGILVTNDFIHFFNLLSNTVSVWVTSRLLFQQTYFLDDGSSCAHHALWKSLHPAGMCGMWSWRSICLDATLSCHII